MPDTHHLAHAAVLSALLALAAPAPVRADAPLVSETADVIGAGDCQVEAALARTKTHGQPAASSGDLLASCGVAGHSQAALGHATERVEGLTAHSLRAVGKTALVAPEAGRTGWGLRYGVSFAKAAGRGWRYDGLELLAAMTHEARPGLLVHANLGHADSRSAGRRSTTWSMGVEQVARGATLAADVFGDDHGRTAVSAGIGLQLSDAFSVNASVAVGFEQPRPRQVTLGAKLVF